MSTLLVDERIVKWLKVLLPFAFKGEILFPVYLFRSGGSYVLLASGKPEIHIGFIISPRKKIYYGNTFLHTHIFNAMPSNVDLRVRLPFFLVTSPPFNEMCLTLRVEPPERDDTPVSYTHLTLPTKA